MTTKMVALPYQREGVRLLEALRPRYNGIRGLLADEMGLGKTAQACWLLKRNPDMYPAVVVCPVGLKVNWQREAAECAGVQAAILDGTKPPPPGGLLPPPRLSIINYDILYAWVPYLLGQGVRTIILDECQRIQNLSTRCTVAAHALADDLPHALGLSGTPLANRPADLYSIAHLLWPQEFTDFFTYGQRYCKPQKKPWGWEYKGAKNLPELHQRLKGLGMVRRLKKDVLHDLPQQVRRVLHVGLHDPEGNYKAANGNFLKWLHGISPAAARRASRAEKLTQLGYLKQLAARYKLRACMEWVDSFLSETDEKIVLFGHHLKCLDALQRRYDKLAVRVDGGVTGRHRQWAVDEFQRNPAKRVFLGNESAYEGITLTAAATVAFLEFDWRPAKHLQGESRVHRIGQTEPTWAYYFVAANTIEEYLCEILQEKQANINQILDGDAEAQVLDVLDQLMERMIATAA